MLENETCYKTGRVSTRDFTVYVLYNRISFWKRGSLLGNEEIHLGGDSPIFEIEYSNLEQRSIFSKKSTHFYVRIKIGLK